MIKVLTVVLGILVFWFALSIVSARVSGWAELAKTYPYADQPVAEKRHFQSVSILGGGNYNWCVTLGVGKEGLYASMFGPLGWGHAPVFVPWSDIAIRENQYKGIPVIELSLTRLPRTVLRIREGHEFVRAAAN